MQNIKLRFYYLPFYLLATTVILFASCKKDPVVPPPTTTSTFTLRDTLKLEQQYQTGQYADLYNQYNVKFYSVNSSNKISFTVQQAGANIEFLFTDSSVTKLYPSFLITIKNATFQTMSSQYNLANNNAVTVRDFQTFVDGSAAISPESNVFAGTLKINYNNSLKTASGEINNLKTRLEYYTPENITVSVKSSNGIFIKNGGSTRTVFLQFNHVKVK